MLKLKLSEKTEVVEKIRVQIGEEIDTHSGNASEYLADAVVGVKFFDGAAIEDFFEDAGIFTGDNLEDESGRVYDAVSFKIFDVQLVDGSWWVGGAKFELDLTAYMAGMLEHSRAVVQEREDRLELD